MLLGYNTNGLSDHRLSDAIRLLAEIGYRSVAITINHGSLSPNSTDWRGQCEATRDLLREFDMRSVVETGARFLLDPRQKHEPTLVTADSEARARRVDFLRHAIDVAEHGLLLES